MDVAKANLVAQQAAVRRLDELARFKKIAAPFDGVVTERNVDIGDLVTANGTSGKPLFRVSDIHRVRIYVDVPQALLGGMQKGLKATLELPGHKGRYRAELVNTSNAVGEDTRTALIELQADNPDGKLWPGSFAEVEFHIPAPPGTLLIPASALVFGRHGMEVAKVGDGSKVALAPIVVGRNLGNEIEITSGVALDDALVDNPQETIVVGETVKIMNDKKRTIRLASDAPRCLRSNRGEGTRTVPMVVVCGPAVRWRWSGASRTAGSPIVHHASWGCAISPPAPRCGPFSARSWRRTPTSVARRDRRSSCRSCRARRN